MTDDLCPQCGKFLHLDQVTGWCERCTVISVYGHARQCEGCDRWHPGDGRRCSWCKESGRASNQVNAIRRANARCAYCRRPYCATRRGSHFCADHERQRRWYHTLILEGYAEDLALRLACQENIPAQLCGFCIICGATLKRRHGRFCTGKHGTERNIINRLEKEGVSTSEALLRTRNRRRQPWVIPPQFHTATTVDRSLGLPR
jgi:hypothetical protein